MTESKTIAVVVAVRNELDSIPVFVESLRGLDWPRGVQVQIVFVEDGSSDGTVAFLRQLAAGKQGITYYSLARGFGQGPAVAFGLRQVTADAMVMMDVDGGHPTKVVPEMVRRWLAGAHIVQAIRTAPRFGSPRKYRRWGTLLFNFVMDGLTGIHTAQQNVYFRLVRQEVAEELLLDRRWPHFLRIRFQEHREWKIEYVEFETVDRSLGQSKYDPIRLTKLAVKAYFSTVSHLRFAFQWFGVGFFALMLGPLGYPNLAAGGIVFLGVIAIAFLRISASAPLHQLTVRESSDSGPVKPARLRR